LLLGGTIISGSTLFTFLFHVVGKGVIFGQILSRARVFFFLAFFFPHVAKCGPFWTF